MPYINVLEILLTLSLFFNAITLINVFIKVPEIRKIK